jgi:hypothetical protein
MLLVGKQSPDVSRAMQDADDFDPIIGASIKNEVLSDGIAEYRVTEFLTPRANTRKPGKKLKLGIHARQPPLGG